MGADEEAAARQVRHVGVGHGPQPQLFEALDLDAVVDDVAQRVDRAALREGAFGLGAGKWRTIRTVVLPSCVDGIVTGCILSIGRILGESAALLFTAGSAHMLYNFFEGMHNAGATLTVALYFYAKESSDTGVVFAIAAILMLLTMLINLIADLVGRYFRRKQQ